MGTSSAPASQRAPESAELALTPWSTPPPAHLLALAPLEFWEEHQILPLREVSRASSEILLVACPQAQLPSEIHQQLERLTGRPVQVVPARSDEVAFWLEVLPGRRTWPEAFAD